MRSSRVAPGGEATSYAYDPFGGLTRAEVGEEWAAYTHDALGRTTSRTDGEGTTFFSYSGETQELAREATGGEATRYANAPSGPLARKAGEGDPEWLLRDVHTDLVGTVGGEGELTGGFSYDPWGEPRHREGESNLGFQADPTDPLTGLVDMGARDYDPTLGRFTTRDPLFGDTTEPMTLNQFLYGLGSPLTFSDPEGLDAFRVSSSCRLSCPRSMRRNRADRSHASRSNTRAARARQSSKVRRGTSGATPRPKPRTKSPASKRSRVDLDRTRAQRKAAQQRAKKNEAALSRAVKSVKGRVAGAASRGAKAAGRFAWKYKWDILLTAASIAVPAAGAAIWATRAARVAGYANKALSATRIGGKGVWLRGKHVLSLNAPHRVSLRHAPGVAKHVGRWHWHTGPGRTPRPILRFWRTGGF